MVMHRPRRLRCSLVSNEDCTPCQVTHSSCLRHGTSKRKLNEHCGLRFPVAVYNAKDRLLTSIQLAAHPSLLTRLYQALSFTTSASLQLTMSMLEPFSIYDLQTPSTVTAESLDCPPIQDGAYRVEGPERIFYCPDCLNTYKTKMDRDRHHLVIHRPNEAEKMWVPQNKFFFFTRP